MKCLHALRGEWSLCLRCFDERMRAAGPVIGDFRSAPRNYWVQLYNTFPNQPEQFKSAPDTAPGQSRGEVVEMIKQRGVLESRLDYMAKYLEMDRSGITPQCIRDEILERIKSAMRFLKGKFTSQDIDQRIHDLDQFMEEAVNRTTSK